ncbi:hypothetical protein CEK28_14300 [Xenophilus sp. AP218F]|nr:hypothetical protein [Chromobacterium sp. ASV5]OWY38092.1 hypothetical protein CEK28_14300 [Xenophilus sp. AP218F]
MRTSALMLLASASLLAACSQEQAAQLQNTASAAIGAAHNTVKDASAPLADLKKQASAAVGIASKVGEAAAVFNPELKEQVDQLKEQASAAKGVINAVSGK